MVPETMKEWMTMMMAFLAIIVFHFFWGHKQKFADINETTALVGESYEMQRVKNDFISRFDLHDRVINFQKIFNKKPAVPGLMRNGLGAMIPPKPAAKKTAKAAAKKGAKAKDAEGLDAENPNGEETPAQVLANEADAEVNPGVAGPRVTDTPPGGPGVYVPPRRAAPAPAQEKLTQSQWISVLTSNPTSAEIQQFIAAKKSLGTTSYYAVVSYLLENNSTTVQQTGEKIISSDVSASTFVYISDPPAAVKSNTAMTTFLSGTVQSYGQSASNFPILAQVLTSQDAMSIVSAENLIETDLQKAGQVSASGNTGSKTVNAFSVSQFSVFKTPLVSLESNSNSQVAQLAKTIVTQLGTGGAINTADEDRYMKRRQIQD